MSSGEGPIGPGDPSIPPPPPPGFEPPETGEHPPMVSQMVGADFQEQQPRSRKKWIFGGVGAAVLALVAGGGAWAVIQFLSSSGDPVTSALPDTTVAFAAIDLDPSASQKIAAIEFMSKFPGITDNLSFDPKSSNDLRKWFTDSIAHDSSCPNFSFDTQIAPWLGKRAAVAGAPNAGGTLTPFGVIQVTDQQKAKDAIANNFGCQDTSGTSQPTGIAFVGQYLVLADKQADADYFAQQAKSSPLQNDADYQAMMAKVGDPGIAMAYVSPNAAAQLVDQLTTQTGLSSPLTDAQKQQLDSFKGAALAVRFNGGAIETQVVMSTDGSTTAQGAASPVADLPDSTALAFGNGYAPGAGADAVKKVWDQLKQNDPTYQRDVRGVESQTGLTLPDDLVTLFGNGYAFAVDSSLDPNIFNSPTVPDGSAFPVGFRLVGDPQAISAVLQKIDALVRPAGIRLYAEKGDGVVGASMSSSYAKQLAGSGGLGATDSYKSAVSGQPVPDGVLYANMGDIASWIQKVSKNDPSTQSTLDNMAPLDAFGMSSHTDGNDLSMEFRLTTH